MRGIKNIRLPGHDYRSPGYYFVTAVANWRQPLFAGKQKMILTLLQKTVAETLGARLDATIIRRDHVHFIIELEQSNALLGTIIRRFKARTSYELKVKAWQPNYYESIIRTEEGLARVREYIIRNPEFDARKNRKFYKDLGVADESAEQL